LTLGEKDVVRVSRIGSKEIVERLLLMLWSTRKNNKSLLQLRQSMNFESVPLNYSKVKMDEYYWFDNGNALNDSPTKKKVEEETKLLFLSLRICNFEGSADSIIVDEKLASKPAKLLELLDVISDGKAFRCYPKLELQCFENTKVDPSISDKNQNWFSIKEKNSIGRILAAFIEYSIMKSFEACGNGTRQVDDKDELYFRLREDTPKMVEKNPELLEECKGLIKSAITTHQVWRDKCNDPPSKLQKFSREQMIFNLVYTNHFNPQFGGYSNPENLYDQLCHMVDQKDKTPLISMILHPQLSEFGCVINVVLHLIYEEWAVVINNLRIEQLVDCSNDSSSVEKKKKKKKKKNKKNKKKDQTDEKPETEPEVAAKGTSSLYQAGPEKTVPAEREKAKSEQMSPPVSFQNINTVDTLADSKTIGRTTQGENVASTKADKRVAESAGSEDQRFEIQPRQEQVGESIQESSLKSGNSRVDKRRANNKYKTEATVNKKEDEVYSSSVMSQIGGLDKICCTSVGGSEYNRDHMTKARKLQNPDKLLRKKSFGNEDSPFKSNDLISNEFDTEKAVRHERYRSSELKFTTKTFDISELNLDSKPRPDKKMSLEIKQPFEHPPTPILVTIPASIPLLKLEEEKTIFLSKEEEKDLSEASPLELNYAISAPVQDKSMSERPSEKKPKLKKVLAGAKRPDPKQSSTRLKLKKLDKFTEEEYKRKDKDPKPTSTSAWNSSTPSQSFGYKEKASSNASPTYVKRTLDEKNSSLLRDSPAKDNQMSDKKRPLQKDEPAPIPVADKKKDGGSSKYSEPTILKTLSEKQATPTKLKVGNSNADQVSDTMKFLNMETYRVISDMRTYGENTELIRQIAKGRVEIVMKQTFDPDCTAPIDLKAYGSSETRLIVPDSDIDLLISVPGIDKTVSLQMLEYLCENLKIVSWVTKTQLHKEAAVPVLKIDIDVSEPILPGQFADNLSTPQFLSFTNQLVPKGYSPKTPLVQKVDLIVETEDNTALQTTKYVKKSIEDYPEKYDLSLLLKLFLNYKELNKPYHGRKLDLPRRDQRLRDQRYDCSMDRAYKEARKVLRRLTLPELPRHGRVLRQAVQPQRADNLH
jgi:hypothetical protein